MENTNTETKLIKCRKCGGPHLTIKCGKNNSVEKPVEKSVEPPVEQPVDVNSYLYKLQLSIDNSTTEKIDNNIVKNIVKKADNNDTDQTYKKYEKSSYPTINKVKISNLPLDLTQYELTNLLEDWGHINRVTVKNYNDSTVAYVEFKFKDEVEYFIDALSGTSFEHHIIYIEKLES